MHDCLRVLYSAEKNYSFRNPCILILGESPNKYREWHCSDLLSQVFQRVVTTKLKNKFIFFNIIHERIQTTSVVSLLSSRIISKSVAAKKYFSLARVSVPLLLTQVYVDSSITHLISFLSIRCSFSQMWFGNLISSLKKCFVDVKSSLKQFKL